MKILHATTKISHAATKTQHSQMNKINIKKKKKNRNFLVAQWLRIHLPTQGTRVRALVREDPTCCRATKPVRHNY